MSIGSSLHHCGALWALFGVASQLTVAGPCPWCTTWEWPEPFAVWSASTSILNYIQAATVSLSCLYPLKKLLLSFNFQRPFFTFWTPTGISIDVCYLVSVDVTLDLSYCWLKPWRSSLFSLLCWFTHCESRLLLWAVPSKWVVVRESYSWESGVQVKSRQGQAESRLWQT